MRIGLSDLLRLVHCLLGGGSQPVHSCCHLVTVIKDCRSGHQHVRSCRYSQRSRGRIDAAVQLQFAGGIGLPNHLTHAPDLGQSRVEKMLMPEAS
jgi:hypothetical protein